MAPAAVEAATRLRRVGNVADMTISSLALAPRPGEVFGNAGFVAIFRNLWITPGSLRLYIRKKYIESLAHPGGNATGFTGLDYGFGAKNGSNC